MGGKLALVGLVRRNAHAASPGERAVVKQRASHAHGGVELLGHEPQQVGVQADDEFPAAQLDIELVEHHLGQADEPLAPVERLHVRTRFVQDVANPMLDHVIPQLVGSSGVAHGLILRSRRMLAHERRANVHIAAFQLQHGFLGRQALVDVEHQRQGRSYQSHVPSLLDFPRFVSP